MTVWADCESAGDPGIVINCTQVTRRIAAVSVRVLARYKNAKTGQDKYKKTKIKIYRKSEIV